MARWAARVRRAARVLRAFWAANLAEELQYRANFLASLLATAFWLGMAVLTAAIFFRQTDALGGWSFWEVVALLGIFNAGGGVVDAVLRPNIGRLVDLVRRGTLDLVLAKPIDAQFHVSFRRLVVWRLSDVAFGLALSAYALTRLDRAPDTETILAFVLTLAAASVIVYALWLGLMSLAFWFVDVENLGILFDALYEAGRFPVSAYPAPVRFVLVYLLPIAWITTVPAATLTGRVGLATALIAALVAVAALLLTRLLWRAALRRYTSAGG
ncbi:MAG TPA: ABC-2 family transporter protein [Longimicrobiales bacterium]